MKKLKGFSLIELMVTVAIAAVLAMVAIPGYLDFQRNSELISRTNTLVASLNTARSEAMKSGRYAMAIPSDGIHWESGVIVFVDNNGNKVLNEGTDHVVYKNTDPFPSFLISSGTNTALGANPYILFDAQGYPKTSAGSFGNVTLSIARNDVSTDRQSAQTRRIIVSKTGRLRTCTPSSSTDSTCAEDNSGTAN